MQGNKWIDQMRDGEQKGVAPLIISASRSTDIPAWHEKWFMKRLDEGYMKWVNPFNQRPQYVFLNRAKVFVFWSKNPQPLMAYLNKLDERGLAYYFQFTLNDYEAEGFEPQVPELANRIATFRELSARLGKERVIWRFDPLILAKGPDIPQLLDKIKRIGEQIAQHTTKLVFSFADITAYRKVQHSLRRESIAFSEFAPDQMKQAAKGIADLCREWHIDAATCAEKEDLTQWGIKHNKCIDDDLILRISDNDPDLCHLFGVQREEPHAPEGTFPFMETDTRQIKDPGQRKECGCIISKDIGAYNTCGHFCVYCYANTSATQVQKNLKNASVDSHTICATDSRK